jgi:hypothetical protein
MLLTSLKVSTGHVNKARPDPAHQFLSPARPEARLFFKILTRAGCPWASPTRAGLYSKRSYLAEIKIGDSALDDLCDLEK